MPCPFIAPISTTDFRVGIWGSSGSACLADSDEPFHVIIAMKPKDSVSRQMIRFSLGMGNTAAEISDVLSALTSAAKNIRS